MTEAEAKEAVDRIIQDIEESTYMGSMLLCLAPAQRERMKQRWVKLILASQVEHDWANY